MRQLSLLVAILGCNLALQVASADETKEPLLELTLFVDGKPLPIELEREQTLAGSFNNPKVVVRAAPTRKFSYGGISFEYPASFTWEAEIEGKAYRNWTISGNEAVIMYFVLDSEFTPEVYAESMADQFGAEKVTSEPVNRTFGKNNLKGKRATIIIGEIQTVQEAFAIPAPAGEWRLLVLQDIVPELTPDLEEPKRVLDLLTSSLNMEQ